MRNRRTDLWTCAIVLLLAVGVTDGRAQSQEVFKPGAGVTFPKPTHEERPQYTKEAITAGIQGSVLLMVVVQKDGTVGEVTVTRSLDKEHGLDDQAVKAARAWRFEPGTKDGKPVAVEVTLELTFTLRAKKEK